MKRKIIFTVLGKCILIVFLLFFTSLRLLGQSVTNYTFAGTTASFTPISAGSTTTWTGSTDDAISAIIPIGFDFWYMGTRYTNIAATTNGWLSLGLIPTSYDYTNNLSGAGSPRPIIAPLWDDLDIVATSNVTYKTTGTAGTRIFTIQYLNVKWNYQASGSVCSFQVKFYEGTGKIDFVYRSDAVSANVPSGSIGLTATATGSTNFLSVNNAGTSVSSTTEANITTKRVSGRTYAFSPPLPTAPGSLTFTGVGSTAMTLNWTDLSTNETGFVIYRSTDGINYVFNNQTAAATISSVQSGLTTGVTYYWKVYAVSEGRLSTALSGSQLTSCTAPSISQLPASGLISYYKFEGNVTDVTGNNNGTFQGGTPSQTPDRYNNVNKAYIFNGTSNNISTANAYVNPGPVSTSIWFKTTTTIGGVLIGFSSMQTGGSGSRDRFIYMTGTGVLYLGVAPVSVKKYVNTTNAYNDGNWHMVTSTLGAGGLKLYVDGLLTASDATVTSAENYTGYWRIGYDDIYTWPNEPASHYFQGTLDDAIIYHRELTSTEVATLYNSPDGAGSNSPVCAGESLNMTATTVGGATYSWTGPNGFTSSLQNPNLLYAAAYAGVYTVQVTTPGCATISTAYTKVVSASLPGQWTGNISTDWASAGNWCDGNIPTSTTNVIISTGAIQMPIITSSVSCGDLLINAGATVTLSIAGTLNISGTLANSGTFTNNGTLNFNGTTGQQSFSGVVAFYNLTLNNSDGLLLPGAITVNNNLSIAAGILNANNFNIAVKGNWANTASAIAFTAGTATLTFNGTTAQTISGTFTTTFNNLTIFNTGNTVTLTANVNIAGNLSVSGGTFNLDAFTANRISEGGILTVSNNATLKIGGTGTYPTNYTGNTLVVASTVEYSGTNQTIANQSYGNLKLSSSGGAAIKTFPGTALTVVGDLISTLGTGTAVTFTAASAITIGGNVSIGTSTTFNGGSYLHSTGGNWVNIGTFNGNTGTVTFTGPSAIISGSGVQNFNNLTIAASLVSFTSNSISLTGNLATTGSGSFSHVPGGTLLMTGTGTTISGVGISLDNLTISGSVTSGFSFSITGNLLVSGSFTGTANTITLNGTSKTISGSGTKSFSVLAVPGTIIANASFSVSSGLTVNGAFSATAGTATFTATSVLSGTANLFNVIINGTSLQLSANSILGIANLITITTGILDVTTSAPNTVNFNGTGAQDITAVIYSNLMLSNGNNKTALTGLTINNSLTIGTGTTFIPGAFTHSLYNDWNNYGTFTAGTSTIQFLGNVNSNVNGATTFNVLTINNATSTVGIILQNNISAAIVNMTVGTILTGINTLTITDTRTGNGIILGNINRTHAFTTGIAYAFEGPDNTVSFAAISAVTSVTVSVVKGPVSDFPFGGSISRVYTIAVPAGTYNASLRLHYEDNELNGSVEPSMELWHYNGSIWVSSGKTAYSTTDNYVEQSGLTNITDRWTCSDNSNVVQWNGSVSSDWNTVANWTVLQGSASRPPSATDIVNIGTVAFTNQPTISSVANGKNINFGSIQPVTLSMGGGGSLTCGDIKGTWNGNITHTINVNNQSIIINGDLSLSDGISGHAINLNIGSGNIIAGGAITQSGGANIVFSGTGNLSIGGDFNYLSGTFIAGTGTVTYNGLSNQEVGAVGYNHLTINKATGIAAISTALNIAGNLTVTNGSLNNNAISIILGDMSIASGATLHNNSTLSVGGNWNNAGNYSSDNSGTNVIFNGTGAQSISAITFNNLEFNKPVGSVATLTGAVTLKGNLLGTSGTLDIQSFFFNRDVPGGTATIGNAGTLIIAADNAPNKFSTYSLGSSSTVVFNGTTTQHLLLPGVTYGNLVFRNSGLKILYTPITVNGDLTIETGATFDGGSNTLTLNGHWVNNGTFTPSTSTVLCAGIAKNISGNTTFNRVTVVGTYTILNNVTFNSLLSITSTGSLSGGSTINTILNGDLINSGVLYTLGTTTFTGNVLQTLSLINAVNTVAITVNFNGSVSPVLNSTSPPQYGFLNINNTAGVNPSVGWTILYALTVGNGASFNGGVSVHNILGSVTNNGTITSNGTLNFIPSTAKSINFGNAFSSTGTLIFGGAGAITLSGTPGSLHNVLISNTNIAGINPLSDWNMTNNFTVASGSILNAGTNSYTIGGNISNNGTINCGTSTFTLNGTVIQDIYSVSAFNNLNINNTAGSVTLSSDAAVNGILNFIAGKIKTNNNLLIQPSSGTVTGAAQNTGWVNGKLQKSIETGPTSKTFETGDADNYTPVAIVFSNVTTTGNLTSSVTPEDHPNLAGSAIVANKSVNRYWTLINNGVVFDIAALTLNWAAGDIDVGSVTANFKVGNYSGSGWTLPTVTSPQPTSIQVTALTALDDFSVGEICDLTSDFSYTALAYCLDAGNATPTITGIAGTFTSTAGLFIDSITGVIDLAASTPGIYTVTNRVTNANGCESSFEANITIGAMPSVSAIVTPTCVGGSTGTITAKSTGGLAPYTYNLDMGVYQSSVLFTDLAAGTYMLYVKSSEGCIASTSIIIAPYGNSADDQNTAGSNSWIGHMYDGTNFTDYIGHFTETETFDELFGGNTVCFDILSNSLTRSIYTETFSVKFKMNSTKKGLYVVDLGSDDGSRLTVDGALVYNNWIDNGFTTKPSVLIGLTGTSALLYEFYENAQDNRVIFQNLTLLLANTLSVNITQSICLGNSGVAISGDSFGVLPAGITLSGTGYQWVYSTTSGGVKTDITGATEATFTPSTTVAPFNTAGVYYIYRNAIVSSTNNIAPNPYPVTSGSNEAIITVAPAPSATISYLGSPYCSNGGTASVTRTGTANGVYTSVAGLTIDSGTGDIVLASSLPGIYTVTYTISASENCDQYQITTLIQIVIPGEWSGAVSTAWNISGNWLCGAIPTTATNVVIPEDLINYPLLSTGIASIQDITIASGASLTITDAALQIAGTINNSGTFTVSNGTIEMNGSVAQTIPASVFTGNLIRNLTINNASGVILGGSLNLTEILLVTTGQFSTNGHLTLISSAAKTALIDGNGGGTVSGNVTMQRYLIAGFGYKYFSSPFQDATVNSFAPTVDLNASFPNFFNYIENKASSGFTSYTDPSNLLYPLQGYAADFGPSAVQKTVNMTGLVNDGILSATLYNNNQPYTQGFNLVGNPYPSPIDWDSVTGWTRTNIDNAVYFFDSGSVSQYTGTYCTYINGVSSDGIAGPIIASMQGFFVHVSDGTYPVIGAFAINNDARVNDLSPVFHNSTFGVLSPSDRILIRLSANFYDYEQSADPLVIYSADEATSDFDKGFDAIKLMNIDNELPNLYSMAADTSKLVINALSGMDATTVIPLGIKTERDGTVSFNLRDLENWPVNLNLYLTDAVTGINKNLQENPVYTVNLKKGITENRFSLRCIPADGAPGSNGNVYIAFGSGQDMYLRIKLINEQSGTLIIRNIIGQVISSTPISGNGDYKIEHLTSNLVYLASFITSNGNHTVKIIITDR